MGNDYCNCNTCLNGEHNLEGNLSQTNNINPNGILIETNTDRNKNCEIMNTSLNDMLYIKDDKGLNKDKNDSIINKNHDCTMPRLKPKEQTLIEPLVDKNFSSFLKSNQGVEISSTNNNLLPIKIHPFLVRFLTKKAFDKKKNLYIQNTNNIYSFCKQEFYNNNDSLKLSDLNPRIQKFNKNGYSEFYPNTSEDEAIKNKFIIVEDKGKKINDDYSNTILPETVLITYENNDEMNNNIKLTNDINLSKNTNLLPTKPNQLNQTTNNILYSKIKSSATTLYKGTVNLSNLPHGFGTILTKTGSKSLGYFLNGVQTGWGYQISPQGTIYYGLFSNNSLNGKGQIYTLKSNTEYIGDVKDNKKHGKGTEKNKEYEYNGNFINDLKNGKGKMTFFNGDIYDGDFKDNKYNGEGHFIYGNQGYEYTGQYKDGLMHGKGLFKWNQNEYYKGNYVKGVKEGEGEMKWSNGRMFVGPFKNGKPNGVGLFDNGFNFKGNMEFIDGKLNKEFVESKFSSESSYSM